EFWTRTLALSLHLRRECPEARVGLMLPASIAACVGWLALLLAGKTPVMLNWTTGPTNFGHCVRLSGIRRIVSARGLLDRLAAQGFDPQAAEDAGASWLLLEEEAAKISPLAKISALARSRLALRGLERVALPKQAAEHAAILFTSGSESAPKGVPLSHENILANCRDISRALVVTSRDRLLAMLPPFHSLGLTITMVLPLCFGMPVVTHPNPTEAARLNRLCRRWKPTIVVAPPTFLAAMLRQAQKGDLASLRLGVVGAEACPLSVYEAFAAQCGGVLCEGYGITECAPVVSVNRPEAPRPATIGQPLPSVQTVVVTVEGSMRRMPEGETGMLLVRGPNIFAGYLAGKDMPPPADPFVAFEGERWYRTGDLVRQAPDGHLTFAGRLGRFVKLGGEMISLPQMEQVLLAYQAARDAQQPREENAGPALAVEAVERDGQPELVLCSSVPFTVAEANNALRKAGLAALYAVRSVLEMETLPLLGSGKTDYRTLKRLLAENVEKTTKA
ncbi:MAG: AMP-binding protein, partial [Deltaproteobacteria bacterium]|nr:AMP-binding protein [Deltaproteobacteria bacterium]